ncbi:MAG: hypothetical protein ACYS7Y_32250 [Planctomycetota bacterium]
MRLIIPPICPKDKPDGHNYVVDLECPEGGIIRLLIPVDPDSYEGRCARIVPGKCEEPVGLNLVCGGHYT